MDKVKIDKLREKNIKYWKDRNEKLFLEGETDAIDKVEKLKKAYEQALKQIEVQINVYYGKYASENGIKMAESRKLLTKQELKDFKSDLKEFIDYAKNNSLDDDYVKKLRLMQYRAKLSRIDELKSKIEFEVQKLSGKVQKETGEILEDTFEEGYYRTVFNTQKFFGFGTDFAGLNQKAIQKAVLTPYMEENYKDVYWRNNKNLTMLLNQQIPQGIILGYNPKKVAMIAEKRLKTDYNKTARLVRTEYNLVLNDSIMEGYKACGIQQYEILATLDSRTSEICQAMDGQVFDVNKKEVGLNYPPFHPNCRSTTVPYFKPDDIDEEFGIGTRLAKDEDGQYYKVPANTTYEEWKNALKPKKDGTVIYENEIANFQPATTRDEAKMKFKDILGANQVDLGNMKLEVANEYLEGTNIFLNEYPELKNFVTNIDTNVKNSRDLAVFNSGNKYYKVGNATYNTQIGKFPTISFKSPRDLTKYYDNRKYSVETGFHYEGFTGKSTAAHELTHALQQYIFRLEKGLKGFDLRDKYISDEYIAKEIILQARKDVFGDFYGKAAYEGTKYLGKYAQVNFSEQLAQAVSYELTVGTNTYSARVKELLDERLKEALKK